jgi:hypothetical protein
VQVLERQEVNWKFADALHCQTFSRTEAIAGPRLTFARKGEFVAHPG